MSRGNRAAVVDGKLQHFSCSQIKEYLRCPRAWYAGKVLGLRSPRKPGAERGVALHTQPEAYYRDGTQPTHEAFLAAMHGLPKPHPDILIEHELKDPTLYVEDVRLDGYSDLIVPGHLMPDGIPYVIDHKFVSSFRYTEDPANDLQMLLYGYWVSRKWPDTRQIRLGLHYYLQDGSDFKPRVAVVPVERCESEWEDIVFPTVLRMRSLAAQSYQLEECPDNRGDACFQYGGCYLMERCGVVSKATQSRATRRILEEFDAGLWS